MRKLVMACLLTKAANAQAGVWPAIDKALRTIPSAAHGSAWGALKACRMKIDRQASDLANLNGDPRNQRLYFIAAVPPPGEEARAYSELLLHWEIKNGKAIPMSNWAIDVQNKPIIAPWLGC